MTYDEEWIKDIEEERQAYSIRSKYGFFLIISAFLLLFLSDYFTEYVENIYIVISFLTMLFLAGKLLSSPLNDIDLFVLYLYSIGKRVEHFGHESAVSIEKNRKILKNCHNKILTLKNLFKQGESHYIKNIHKFLNNIDSIILKLNNLNQPDSGKKFNINKNQLASGIKELAILIHEETSLLNEKPLEKLNEILNSLKDVDEKVLKMPFPKIVYNYMISNFWKPLPTIMKMILVFFIIGAIVFYILSYVAINFMGIEESIANNSALYGSMMVIAALISQAHRISERLKANS